ncbi:MAG: haloacid dehalogenase [Armatimonadetes bacterium]|nr:haloacid dehalogenase [Armatimonadota bacterium]MDE2205785.1 haloacid dehalogenase [Armatimonadota bacterium]
MSESIDVQLESICAGLRDQLAATNGAREAALRVCRTTIQGAARSIRAAHRGDMERATAQLEDCSRAFDEAKRKLAGQPQLLHAGYMHDAEKEVAEAALFLAIVGGKPLPGADDLGADPAAWLRGLAEAASECRRYALDRLRDGELDTADATLDVMEAVYSMLITFDFPDAITGGLRATTDQFRAVLERTRGDVTLAVVQRRLEQAVREMHALALPEHAAGD